MISKVNLTGRCMCGAVRLTGTAKEPKVGACHCDMCRRWSSGPFFEVSCENVAFEGEDSITKIRSSDWAERGFCNKCGSNLFYHIIDSNEFQIAAGLLDDQSALHLYLQVFTDRKPPFYTLADKTETMTAAEVYAAFGAPSD
ncbi:MAG: GFA family protein [Anderseniella sp.]